MTQTSPVTIAFVPIARPTFDVELARHLTGQVRAQLNQTEFQIIGPTELIMDLEAAQATALELADASPDLLLVLQASFADSTMILALAQTVNAPLLMWGVPEAHTGGRLRLNSMCGINLAAHGLTRLDYQYDYIFASPDEAAALEKVTALARAAKVRRLLQGARLGRVGPHPAGFDTCRYDSAALERQLGVEVVEVSLADVFEQAQQAPPARIEAVADTLRQTLPNFDDLEPEAARGTLTTYATLHDLAEREQINGLAVRCWPEFFTEMGCAACGAMSMLSNEQTPCSCEADVNGTITQLMLQWLSGEPAFGTDLVSVDTERDGLVLWHCGLAPLSMADPAATPQGTIHSNRQLPLLFEFPLKPGRVTIARLSEATGDYRLVIGGGEMLQAPPSFSGTSGVLRFDRLASEVLDTIMKEGLEHHISMTYGDYVPALEALAKMLEIPVLRIA